MLKFSNCGMADKSVRPNDNLARCDLAPHFLASLAAPVLTYFEEKAIAAAVAFSIWSTE
jgi:hypothetical protein